MKRAQLFYVSAFCALALAIVVSVYLVSYRTNLFQLRQTGLVRLEQTSDRLLGQLESYSKLTNILAKHPTILRLLTEESQGTDVNEFLLRNALSNGAARIFVVDGNGTVIATSNAADPNSSLGQSYLDTGHYRAAMNGRLGFDYRLQPQRSFYYARGVNLPNQRPVGAVIVQIDVARLEFEWHVDEEAVAFFDTDEIVLATNRPALSLRQEGGGASALAQPMFDHQTLYRFGLEIWRFTDDTNLPTETLVLSRSIPQIDLKARVFISTAGAAGAALLQTALAIALLALMALAMWTLLLRRRQLADRLAIEEAANARLEARVAKRSEELRTAQHQLIQASKLTALGQMSAGISHELAQPLATIRAFADNGRKFIERGQQEVASENLSLITQQIDRMTRIIKNLRAFARKEEEPVESVNLSSIVSDAITLSKSRLDKESVKLTQHGLTTPLWVKGGNVRLQQVIVNLMTNAIDAMSEASTKQLDVWLEQSDQNAFLTIRDSGPGIADPSRVFEPFYSTKEVGASKGLGLGLSISYGIIGSFGGDIACRNLAEGGAEFVVSLPIAVERQAA